MLSNKEIEATIRQFARKIGVQNIEKYFTFDSPVGDATPMLCIEDGELCFIISERGEEIERISSVDSLEVLFFLFESITFTIATDYELEHRIPGKDFRRLLFQKQEELMNTLLPVWGEKLRSEHSDILSEAPFIDD